MHVGGINSTTNVLYAYIYLLKDNQKESEKLEQLAASGLWGMCSPQSPSAKCLLVALRAAWKLPPDFQMTKLPKGDREWS